MVDCRWLVLAVSMVRFYLQKGSHKGLYKHIARTLKCFQTFALLEVRSNAFNHHDMWYKPLLYFIFQCCSIFLSISQSTPSRKKNKNLLWTHFLPFYYLFLTIAEWGILRKPFLLLKVFRNHNRNKPVFEWQILLDQIICMSNCLAVIFPHHPSPCFI